MKRRTGRLAVCCLLGILAAAFAALGLSACSGGRWDIAAGADSTVTAQLVETENGTELRIGGRGEMRDFEEGGAPWQDRAEEIAVVAVGSGVTYIGANAFAGIGADYVILPSTVTAAGENFADEAMKIFVFSDVDFASEPALVYTYREEEIVTRDRFWQSDKSSGDIIADGEDLSSADDGRYWRYVREDSDEAQVYEKLKVLFIGNSFTYRNGVVEFSSGVPGLFDGIAEDLGFAVETYSITGPGWYLESHANPSDRCGRQVDKLLSACDDFDYIVLQDQSTCPYRENARFLNGVGSMCEKIESTQTHAEVYLYETWGSPFSSAEDGTTIAEMESKLRSAYTAAGEQFGLHVTYVGAAFTDAYYNGGIYLWDTDNRHQGFAGAYLSAATHVGSMLGADVRETAFTGEGLYDAPALGEETLTALREAAYRAASGELAVIDEGEQGPDGGEDEEQAQILKIACWGRFMKEEKFRRLVDGFETYAKQNGVEYREIAATYYEGAATSDPYYYIANFTAQVYRDGDPDIVLPCATNFNANQATLAAVEFVPVDVYGQTDRQVAAINDDALTKAFLDYVRTDEAAAILAAQD